LKSAKFLIFPLFLILFSSSFIPFSFSSVESEAQEDIRAGCRDEQSLVKRFTNNEYVCVSPSTAERWVELGMAEIISEPKQIEKEKPPQELDPVYFGAPPPPPEKTIDVATLDSECRIGFTLFNKSHYSTTSCIESSTAVLWERLALGKIVEPEIKEEIEEIDEDTEEEIFDEQIIAAQRKEFLKKSKQISLPAYPNQPSIRPELEATNDYWAPPKVHQVSDRIWVAVGYDIANSIMIEGDTGIIIVDTLSSYESAKKVLNEFRKITDKPVKAIILTHSHLDHVHGTKAFLEEGTGNVPIFAHESLLDSYINENSVLGPIASVRTAHAAGLFLPDDGPDRSNMGVFPKFQPGTIAFVTPTHTFSSEISIDISGVKMELVHVAGESSDQLYVWLPEDEALLIGDNIYSIFPNIYTLRGAVYRDPMNYVNALDKVIPLNAKYLVPSHVKPVSGKSEVRQILESTRDATQYVYDQTIRGMNNGYSADELSTMITLPDYAIDNPWISQARGQIPWHVKQIYYGNLGWYEGDPAFLLPVSMDERSQKIVDGFGGVDMVIVEIRKTIDDGEYNWAAELATYVLNIDPENIEAKLLKAHSLRVIGQRMLSVDGRNWALTSALELEGKIIIDPITTSQTSPEQLAEIPIEKLLKSLSTKIDPDKIHGMTLYVEISYTDTGKEYTLIINNDILTVTEGIYDEPENHISLDTETHKKILTQNLSLFDAIDSGLVDFDGSRNELRLFLNAFDPLTINTVQIG
jgi:alkyl sulfatase BDS1-like metallo-beta-lactamase superfamily hydrolase